MNFALFSSPDFFRAVFQEKSCPGRIVPYPHRPGGDTRFRRNDMQAVIFVGILASVALMILFAEISHRRKLKSIEEDYNFLLRFYASYIAFDSESGPSEFERQNARLSYKRVINARLHLTRQQPPIWGALERYFGPVWP